MSSRVGEILLSQRFYPEIGGSIAWMYELFRRWPRPVQAIVHSYPGEDAHRIDDSVRGALQIHRADILMKDWGIDTVHSLVRYCRMFGAVRSRLGSGTTIIYCARAVPELWCLLPLRAISGGRLKLVAFAHGEEILACETSRQLSFFLQQALGRADLVIANSQSTSRLIEKYRNHKPTAVISPGVDAALYSAETSVRSGWRSRHGIADKSVVLLTVARLEKRKNHHSVIEAVAALRGQGLDLRYFIAGSGSQGAALHNLSAQLKLADAVQFLGAITEQEKREALAGSDIFVMPSIGSVGDLEGYGIAFIEAAASGLPSIAGNIGGQAEAVQHERTGLVIDGNSNAALRSAIQRLTASSELRSQMAAQAREFARSMDWQLVLERTLAQTAQL